MRVVAIAALALASCTMTGERPPLTSDSERAAGDTYAAAASDSYLEAELDLSSRCLPNPPYPACDVTVELPTEVRTVIDLANPRDVTIGRCDRTNDEAVVLPDNVAAYPVLVRISSAGFDGTCTSCAQSVAPYGFTRYGVAIDVPLALDPRGEYTVAASVNAPWRVVSGGCGEACPHPCLSHYLEFLPTTCLSSYGRGLGVATDVADPPAAELIVQLSTPRRLAVCCHLRCP